MAYAQPSGPSSTLGANPYFSSAVSSTTFSVSSNNTQTQDTLLLTAPSDQDIIVTGVIAKDSPSGHCQSTNCSYAFGYDGAYISGGVFVAAFAPQLVLNAGESLSVQKYVRAYSGTCTLSCTYYIQGYYVKP